MKFLLLCSLFFYFCRLSYADDMLASFTSTFNNSSCGTVATKMIPNTAGLNNIQLRRAEREGMGSLVLPDLVHVGQRRLWNKGTVVYNTQVHGVNYQKIKASMEYHIDCQCGNSSAVLNSLQSLLSSTSSFYGMVYEIVEPMSLDYYRFAIVLQNGHYTEFKFQANVERCQQLQGIWEIHQSVLPN
jgi:hypothetical protein